MTGPAAEAYLALAALMTTLPLQFAVAWLGTRIARRQERTIEYLKQENRLLLEKLGGRVRLTLHRATMPSPADPGGDSGGIRAPIPK